MDDYILQILRANNVAKVQVKQTLESHADDIQKLQVKKDAIDREIEALYKKSIEEIETDFNQFQERIKPVYAQEYEQRVLDLESRFNDAKNVWYPSLLEGIKNPDGN